MVDNFSIYTSTRHDGLPIHVGLDYHDETISVCVMDQSGEMLFNCDMQNDVSAVAELIAEIRVPVAVAIESCCGSVTWRMWVLVKYVGWFVFVRDWLAIVRT